VQVLMTSRRPRRVEARALQRLPRGGASERGAFSTKRRFSVSGSMVKQSSRRSSASERRSMPLSWLRMPCSTARVRGVSSGAGALQRLPAFALA
jgi:hypothetical protein